MDGFHLPISQFTYMSFCTQDLPGVAESTVSINEGTPSPWGEGTRQGGWVVRESVFFGPHTRFSKVPPLLDDEGYVGWWILRLRLRLRAEWQDGKHNAENESFRIRETKFKGVKYFKIIHWYIEHWFCLMLCSLFFIDVMCIGSFDCFRSQTKKRWIHGLY